MTYVLLSDDRLLAQCEVDTYRASGPGGQKRNKTSSAVRLRHLPTGLAATATESRSQHENKARALQRLRARIALELRAPVDLAAYAAPAPLRALLAAGARRSERARREPAYWAGVQALLDLFEAEACSVGDTARRLGLGSAALSRFLLGDEQLARTVNHLRAARGLRALS